tara:strand:- start:971 stop:1690 length:720 start_codon:yes stop_codon:yes gene_type:complete
MTLWVFGDSYTADGRKTVGSDNWQDIDKNWVELLQEKLNNPILHIHASPGAANEWIFSKVLEHQDMFAVDDYVVVQLSCSSRRWFFEDKPEMSNFQYSPGVNLSKNEQKALESYKRYLINEKANLANYQMIEMALKVVAGGDNAPAMLIIPGFDPIRGIKGTLGHVCFGEFDNEDLIGKYYVDHKNDPRINHMHEENHKILADKIFNYFQTWQQIDLTSGFKSKFINSSNYKQNKQLTS